MILLSTEAAAHTRKHHMCAAAYMCRILSLDYVLLLFVIDVILTRGQTPPIDHFSDKGRQWQEGPFDTCRFLF